MTQGRKGEPGTPGIIPDHEPGFHFFNFSETLEFLKAGLKVAREGWNGKGMYITLIPAGNAMFQGYPMQNCLGMKTADNKMQPGWLASQADMLAEDWGIVD